MEGKYWTRHTHNPGHFLQIKTKCLHLINRLIDFFLLHQWTLEMKTDEHGVLNAPELLRALEALDHLHQTNTHTTRGTKCRK